MLRLLSDLHRLLDTDHKYRAPRKQKDHKDNRRNPVFVHLVFQGKAYAGNVARPIDGGQAVTSRAAYGVAGESLLDLPVLLKDRARDILRQVLDMGGPAFHIH